jgi:AraC-like DNA-binding protein
MHQEFEPPAELGDTIKCFWYDKRDFGEQLSGFKVLPDGYAEIIFHFGYPCSIAGKEGLQPLPSPFMVGLLNQPVVFYSKNQLQILAIRCFPWTVFDLLNLPSGKDPVRTFEHPIARLQFTLNTCMQAGDIEGALTEIKKFFLTTRPHMVPDSNRGNSMLYKAGVAMQQANGALPVSQVAAAAHATVRTLERNFKQSSGHTIKDVSGLMRFEQVRNRLWHHPHTNIAGLAHELGYTDQSHLSREFKRYSGATPAAFARKAKNAQQTAGGDFVAFIQD